LALEHINQASDFFWRSSDTIAASRWPPWHRPPYFLALSAGS